MRKYPAITTALDVAMGARSCSAGITAKDPKTGEEFTKYVPARPLPYYTLFGRWKAAWLVFTGRADALTWEGQ